MIIIYVIYLCIRNLIYPSFEYFFKSLNIITEIRYILKGISKDIFHRIPYTLYTPNINFQRYISYRRLSVVCLFVNSYLFNSHYYTFNLEYYVFHSLSICSRNFASQYIVCNKPCFVTLTFSYMGI